MSSNDKTPDALPSDRTIFLKPRDRTQGEDRAVSARAPSSDDDLSAISDNAAKAYRNPLLRAAGQLLTTSARLRETPHHDDPAGLRQSLVTAVRRFEAQAQAAGIDQNDIFRARYLLCTLLDEAASDTPWGSSGVWSSQSLLVTFHNEARGGEQAFVMLGKLAENVPANRNLLEVFHVCLALGFEGRYRLIEGGSAQLAAIRERLWQMLQKAGSGPEAELSDKWRSDAIGGARRDRLPMWVIASGAALLLTGVYALFLLLLNVSSDSVANALGALRMSAATAAPAPAPAPAKPPPPRLAELLKPQIQQGKVQVVDAADRSTVTMGSDHLFAAGSADVSDTSRQTLEYVAKALAKVPGAVKVVGHTDNVPIRSLRYPSNQALSEARAGAVLDILQGVGHLEPARLTAKGQSQNAPVASNDTPDGRARNRRVEIVLYPTDAQEPSQ